MGTRPRGMPAHSQGRGMSSAGQAGQAGPTTEPETSEASSRYKMQRSVSQLLFSYLPGKTVDWEEGIAIMQLQNVRLAAAWDVPRAKLVLDEIADYLQRWRSAGGRVHPDFPDPRRESGRFTVGQPESIEGDLLDTALHCLSCSRLVFAKRSALAQHAPVSNPYRCPSCGKGPLRQFPHVFVHGCGHLVPVSEWMPTMKRQGEGWTDTVYRLECKQCGPRGIPQVAASSERAKDLIVTCQVCKSEISDGRLNARCPECLRALARGQLPLLPQPAGPGEEGADPIDMTNGEAGRGRTAVSRVLMRVTSYRASEAYYGHSLTLLRLDRPEIGYAPDDEIEVLRRLVPDAGAGQRPPDALDLMQRLMLEAIAARDRGDLAAADTLKEKALRIGRGERPDHQTTIGFAPLRNVSTDITRGVVESLALKTTVRTRPYTEVLSTASASPGGATAGLLGKLDERHRGLKLRPTRLVEDLPVITATFGYTRRSFEAIYEEFDGSVLPTQLRPFFALDAYAAKRLDRAGAAGTVPILAREGEHEGLFLGLDPERVLRWLAHNGVHLGNDGRPPIARVLDACEDIDRYADQIWEKPVRRLVFGLVHSLSHAVMRLVSQSAGIERTSISEYVFLPLLGTVVYANSSAFRMGSMETLMRSSFYEFLERLGAEAMTCIFDPDCLDHHGACAGCLHSPEICCRVFNHGLSRAFLLGGHAPWEDASVDKTIVGYWEVP